MDVAAALPGVPAQILARMPRAEFGRVWARAERVSRERGPEEYYLAGVVLTCRWVAGRELRAPVTGAASWLMPETLDAEYMAALAAARSMKLHPMSVDIARGAVAVLGWMYHGQPEPGFAPPTETG